MKQPTLHACRPLILCAALLLSACGGSSDSGGDVTSPGTQNPPPTNPGQNPPTSPPADPPAEQPSEPPQEPDPVDPQPGNAPYVIEYYGDSTVWGWASGTNGARVAIPAPSAFAGALTDSVPNAVSNEGVNGSTACQLLEGGYGSYPAWPALMQASDATHVIINHGINDENRYDVARYSSCLQQLARIARENGKQVVFETPNPVTDDALLDYVQAMRAVASTENVPVIDQFAYLSDYLDGEGAEAIAPDGVHPSQEVYIMKGEFAAQRFMELFPR